MTAGSRESGRAAALGCRAHTGWAALVVVAGGVARSEVVFRGRAELGDPAGRVRRNVYHAARALEPAAAVALVEAAERIAAEQAAAALERTVRGASDEGAVVRSCAVVVGTFPRGARLESILASHALAHAAEGRLYQGALLQSAESRGLDTIAVPKRSIWEQGGSALGVAGDELRHWIERLRREVGRPGRRTRSWRRSRRGSRSHDRLDAGHASARQPAARARSPRSMPNKVERTGIEPVTSDLQVPGFEARLGQIRSVNAKLRWLREVEIGYSGTRFGTRFGVPPTRGNMATLTAATT
jgi:hypothetical protein